MLNDSLYFKLKKLFKEVKVSSPGVPFIYKTKYDVVSGKDTIEIVQRGETYRICCPYCKSLGAARNDSKFRLWVNHRWGTEIKNFNTYSLVKCYNEDCLSDRTIRNSFTALVESSRKVLVPDSQILTYSSAPSQKVVELPNGSVPISSLKSGHPARLFIEARRFDPDYLSDVYGLHYLEFSFDRPALSNSIVIPIYYNKKLVAWQCRKLDDEVGKSKYITSPGAQISKVLYNWDNSEDYDYAIIVEGVFDVWRLGPPAMCVFGTHLSNPQFEKLKSRYSTVFILFDGDAKNKSLAVCKRFSSSVKMIPVFLEADKDPADYTSDELQGLLADVLKNGHSHASCS